MAHEVRQARTGPEVALRLGGTLACLLAWPAGSLSAQGVAGRVTDALSGAPVAGAQVLVEQQGARIGLAFTDSAGGFAVELRGRRGDRVALRVRRVGYRPAGRELDLDHLPSGGSLHITLERQAVELGEVVVLGARVEARLRAAGFYRRANAGFGHFLTEEDIGAEDRRLVTDALRGIPGVSLVPSTRHTGAFQVYMTRAQGQSTRGPCPARVFLDGIESTGEFDDFLIPEEIAGIEIYRGPSETPTTFGGALSACGVIVIWTK